jgi:hypothetical protein
MAYMAQPSFLVAPDSSGPQFYSVRPFTRNPLTDPVPYSVVVSQRAVP